ncbi:hypothetical protein GQ42DRAFT_149004 [Ramicandelaber brevisporus]|nr:hypothetical protein GQ42DRAFT_149004 [Ramicandelaber brevisporus]
MSRAAFVPGRRAVSTEAAQLITADASTITVAPPLSAEGRSRIFAGVLLQRNPIIIREPTALEVAYSDYKGSLERSNSMQFPTSFYFKKGSIQDAQFQQRERTMLNDIDKVQTGYGPEYQKKMATAGVKQELSESDSVKIELAPRTTNADKINDVKALDRALDRTLYLIVKEKKSKEGDSQWQFVQESMTTSGYLHSTAQSALGKQCGDNMQTWFVGRLPVAHVRRSDGTSLFLHKSHIFSGQVTPAADTVADFAWLRREELEKYLPKDVYESVREILAY